ncbi:MAG TPA: hypothetical protein VFW50_31935 [Streptosporangiaceae bacterium]|nr:hypothetical protein [Streptosporangiaceae bacterium]
MNARDGLDGGRARRGPWVPPAVMRRGVRLIGRRCLDPALPWPAQRARLDQFFRFPLMPRGITVTEQVLGGVPATVVSAGPVMPAGLWHDFVLQPGLLSAADSAVAQAAWFAARVTPPPR